MPHPNGQWRKDLFTIVLSFGQWHASFIPPFLLIPSFKKSQNWQCALTLLTPHGWEAMPLTKQKHFWPLIDGMSIWQCFICPCQQLYHCLDPWLSFMHCLINWQQPESPSPRHCDSSKTHDQQERHNNWAMMWVSINNHFKFGSMAWCFCNIFCSFNFQNCENWHFFHRKSRHWHEMKTRSDSIKQ